MSVLELSIQVVGCHKWKRSLWYPIFLRRVRSRTFLNHWHQTSIALISLIFNTWPTYQLEKPTKAQERCPSKSTQEHQEAQDSEFNIWTLSGKRWLRVLTRKLRSFLFYVLLIVIVILPSATLFFQAAAVICLLLDLDSLPICQCCDRDPLSSLKPPLFSGPLSIMASIIFLSFK